MTGGPEQTSAFHHWMREAHFYQQGGGARE